MNIVVTYHVDKDLYDSSEHRASLITTEYLHRSDILVHLQLGRNLGIRLSNLLRYNFKKDIAAQNEQFLAGKFYTQSKPKPITRSTFEDKMKRFDMSQTVIEREFLEEYSYTDRNGHSDEVQIVITAKDDTMTAVIDFKDTEQHCNFICPAWLVKLS